VIADKARQGKGIGYEYVPVYMRIRRETRGFIEHYMKRLTVYEEQPYGVQAYSVW